MSSLEKLAEATAAITKTSAAVEATAKNKIVKIDGTPAKRTRRKVDDEDEEPKEKRPLYTDLSAWFSGILKQELPTVARVSANRCLLYPACVNEIHGEPGLGKSNVSHACAIATIKEGGSVLVLDPEDTPGGFVKQMRSLSNDDPAIEAACKDGRLKYVHNPDPEMMKAAIEGAIKDRPTLVVMDGLAELLAAEDFDEDRAKDVLKFFRCRVRPFCEKAGSAVLVSDHVTKAGNRGWARGSGAKKGRYDGVSYEIRLGKAYSPSVPGYVKLVVTKDRKGGIGPKDTHVIDLHFSPGEKDGCTNISWKEPAFVPKDNTAPLIEIEKAVVAYLKSLPNKKDSAGNILKAVPKRDETVRSVCMGLAQQGILILTQRGNAKYFELPKIKQMDPKDFTPGVEGKYSAARSLAD